VARNVALLLRDQTQTPAPAAAGGAAAAEHERTVAEVAEGAEPDSFWAALGGRGEYPPAREGGEEEAEARLFQCSNATGAFAVTPVAGFAQSDLDDEDVFLLHAGGGVFVWVGQQANAEEKRMAFETAGKFVQQLQPTRGGGGVGGGGDEGGDDGTPIMRVNAGTEPALFTQHFAGWDSDRMEKNKYEDPLALKARLLKEEEARVQALQEERAVEKREAEAQKAQALQESADAAALRSWSVEELQAVPLPAGVNPNAKEEYLTRDVFKQVFGVDKEDFRALPAWKRVNLRKKHNLF
jgi:villin 1/advillin